MIYDVQILKMKHILSALKVSFNVQNTVLREIGYIRNNINQDICDYLYSLRIVILLEHYVINGDV